MVLPDTAAGEARQIAERLVGKIRQLVWTLYDIPTSINSHYGIATAEPGADFIAVLSKCDEALYRKKKRTSLMRGTEELEAQL